MTQTIATVAPSPLVLRSAEPALAQGRREVVFVETGLADWPTLAGAVPAGLDGADTLFGGQGNDVAHAQHGADRVMGDLGDDLLGGR